MNAGMYCGAAPRLVYLCMFTSGPVITIIHQAAGTSRSTVDRMLRVLRPAGLAPMGEPGRGQHTGHFRPFHLACLLLGFAGSQPSDAAETAEILRKLQFHPQSAGAVPRIPGTLGEVVEALISGQRGSNDADNEAPYGIPDLVLSPDLYWARVIWTRMDATLPDLTESYGAPVGWPVSEKYTPKPLGVFHETTVTSRMLEVASSMTWRDTPERNRTHPSSMPGSVEEADRTASPGRPAVPIGQPATKAPAALNSVDAIPSPGGDTTPQSPVDRTSSPVRKVRRRDKKP